MVFAERGNNVQSNDLPTGLLHSAEKGRNNHNSRTILYTANKLIGHIERTRNET